jgi:hypothetical protein
LRIGERAREEGREMTDIAIVDQSAEKVKTLTIDKSSDHLSPSVGVFAATECDRLQRELQETRDRAERAEFAARTNADTIANMQEKHCEEVSRIYNETRFLRKMKGELDAAIVKLPRFGWVTLTSIIENGLYRSHCPNCKDVSCEGCVPGLSDSLRDQAADLAIERWRRTWDQIV